MEWYKLLNNEQRYWLRTNTRLLVGVDWDFLKIMFTFKEIINILYEKARSEGIINTEIIELIDKRTGG